jgi:hypothetical protein
MAFPGDYEQRIWKLCGSDLTGEDEGESDAGSCNTLYVDVV